MLAFGALCTAFAEPICYNIEFLSHYWIPLDNSYKKLLLPLAYQTSMVGF